MAASPAEPIAPATIRRIGVTFRFFLLAVLLRWGVAVGAFFLPRTQGTAATLLGGLILLVFLVTTVGQGVCAFVLARALDKNVVLQVLLMLLVVAPCLDLLGLAWLNSDAKSALERQGIKVGLMGPSLKDLPG